MVLNRWGQYPLAVTISFKLQNNINRFEVTEKGIVFPFSVTLGTTNSFQKLIPSVLEDGLTNSPIV